MQPYNGFDQGDCCTKPRYHILKTYASQYDG